MAYTQSQIDAYMKSLKDSGKYTDSQVSAYKEHLETSFGPKMVGGGPDNPQDTQDMFKDDASRILSGFSDRKHIQDLVSPDYEATEKNKSGDWVSRGKDGLWYRDAGNLLPSDTSGSDIIQKAFAAAKSMHPVNWGEARLGEALPLAGMGLGGAVGTLAGAPGGPAAAAGAVLGGGAGAGAGEVARQAIGSAAGVRSSYSPAEATNAGIIGASGELLPRVPIPGAGMNLNQLAAKLAQPMLNVGKKGIAGMAAMANLGEVSPEWLYRLMDRPSQVAGADSAEIGNAAFQAARNTQKAAGAGVEQARDALLAAKGQDPVNTERQLGMLQSHLDETAPSNAGTPEVPISERNMAQNQIRANMTTDIPYTPVETQLNYPAGKQIVPTGPTQSNGYLPQATVEDLLKYDQILSQNQLSARNVYGNNPMSAPLTDKSTNFYKRIRDLNKQSLHNLPDLGAEAIPGEPTPIDPLSKDLASADAYYKKVADAAKSVGELKKDTSRETFVGNLLNDGKSVKRDAIQTLAPSVYPSIQDAAAKDAFEGKSLLGLPAWAVRAGLGAVGSGGMYGATHSPGLSLAVGLGENILGNPRVQYQMLKLGSQLSQPIKDQMIPSAILQQGLNRSPWHLLPEENP